MLRLAGHLYLSSGCDHIVAPVRPAFHLLHTCASTGRGVLVDCAILDANSGRTWL